MVKFLSRFVTIILVYLHHVFNPRRTIRELIHNSWMDFDESISQQKPQPIWKFKSIWYHSQIDRANDFKPIWKFRMDWFDLIFQTGRLIWDRMSNPNRFTLWIRTFQIWFFHPDHYVENGPTMWIVSPNTGSTFSVWSFGAVCVINMCFSMLP